MWEVECAYKGVTMGRADPAYDWQQTQLTPTQWELGLLSPNQWKAQWKAAMIKLGKVDIMTGNYIHNITNWI